MKSAIFGRGMEAANRIGVFDAPPWARTAPWVAPRDVAWLRARALLAGELLLVALWALSLVRPYLNFDPTVYPAGRELPSLIHGAYMWRWAMECGPCAMWFGAARGGYPAFADIFQSTLHPLVIVATLGWGVVNGAKLVLVAAFLLNGWAQWWLAYVLGLGPVARLWSAGMAVAGAHLSGRMSPDGGAIGMVLSVGACALILPPLIAFMRSGSRRLAVTLGAVLALAAVSGQQYIQAALVFSAPAVLLLLPSEPQRRWLVVRRGLLALGLAVLLAAPFLVPALHFLPEFAKESDATWRWAQPFPYVPLNLVITDPRFFATGEVLGKTSPLPFLYVIFIGWVPVLLAAGALRGARSADERRAVAFLVALMVLAFWLASAEPLRWLAERAPGLASQLAGIRFPSLISTFAIVPLLGLAAITVDRLCTWRWPRLDLDFEIRPGLGSRLHFNLGWLLVVPLVVALLQVRDYSSPLLTTERVHPDALAAFDAMRTDDLQWVGLSTDEWWFVEPAISRGLKLASDYRSWAWKNRPNPPARLEAARGAAPPGSTVLGEFGSGGAFGYSSRRFENLVIAAPPDRPPYAQVATIGSELVACSAQGKGGDLAVTCNAPQDGVLTVLENRWSGWQAWVNGRAMPLREGQWLAVDVPAGPSRIEFRYRPWDVPLGLLLGLVGLVLAVYLWRQPDPQPARERVLPAGDGRPPRLARALYDG